MLFAGCKVELRSYTGKYMMNNPVPRKGFVKLNGVVVLESSFTPEYLNYRGINILTVDPFKCSLLDDPKTFDTHDDFDFPLKYYLEDDVIDSSVMIALTFDETKRYFFTEFSKESFHSHYKIAPSYFDDEGDYQGTFTIIGQKYRQNNVMQTATSNESLTNPAHVTFAITGIYLFIYLFIITTLTWIVLWARL